MKESKWLIIWHVWSKKRKMPIFSFSTIFGGILDDLQKYLKVTPNSASIPEDKRTLVDENDRILIPQSPVRVPNC